MTQHQRLRHRHVANDSAMLPPRHSYHSSAMVTLVCFLNKQEQDAIAVFFTTAGFFFFLTEIIIVAPPLCFCRRRLRDVPYKV